MGGNRSLRISPLGGWCPHNARPLGRHRVFHTTRALEALTRSGATVIFGSREAATVFFTPRKRLKRSPARAPPWFSDAESAWSTRPLGRHRVFHTTRTIEALTRSGATVIFGRRENHESA